MTEFLQFLVLAFTGLVWWLARRDLTANAARLRGASSAEVDRLKETVEALTAALEERVTTEEKRLSALIAEARSLQAPLLPRAAEKVEASAPMPEPVEARASSPLTPNLAQALAPPHFTSNLAEAPVSPPLSPKLMEVIRPSDSPRNLVESTSFAAPASAAVEPLEETDALATPDGLHLNGEAARSAAMNAVISGGADAPVIAAASPKLVEDAPDIRVEVSPEPAPVSAMHRQVMESERRAALVRAQLAIGLIDPIEIARRTGLPRGEVELLIGLRALRIEPATPVQEPPSAAEVTVSKPIGAVVAEAEPVTAEPEITVSEPAGDDRYAAIYAMLASGVTNSTEIARRTGMGRGEVELILGLRARNVL